MVWWGDFFQKVCYNKGIKMNFPAAGANALLRSTGYRRGIIGIRRRSGRARIARGIKPGDEVLVNEGR